MKTKILVSAIALIGFLFVPTIAQAQTEDEPQLISAPTTTYTLEEVARHDNEKDCYMVFGDKVYALTTYLEFHDKFLDIRSWCGKDMSSAFRTKDGRDRDHYAKTYEKLEDYYVGDLEEATDTDVTPSQPYNFWIPFVVSLVAYLGWYFIAKSKLSEKNKLLSLPIFNFFWNTVLILMLIPTVLFGLIMIFRYDSAYISMINFDWMYWHVEFSVAFGVIVVLHLITRLTQYTVPLNLLKGTKKEVIAS